MTNTQPESMNTQADKSTHGYASVNGLEMYYEIHGTGQPLVLLHGAFSVILPPACRIRNLPCCPAPHM